VRVAVTAAAVLVIGGEPVTAAAVFAAAAFGAALALRVTVTAGSVRGGVGGANAIFVVAVA
jgi:hypothetical protein